MRPEILRIYRHLSKGCTYINRVMDLVRRSVASSTFYVLLCPFRVDTMCGILLVKMKAFKDFKLIMKAARVICTE